MEKIKNKYQRSLSRLHVQRKELFTIERAIEQKENEQERTELEFNQITKEISAVKQEIMVLNEKISSFFSFSQLPQEHFFESIESNNIENIQEFFNDGIQIDTFNKHGLSALHIAIERGNVEAVETLIKYGADVNLLSEEKNCPIHYASMYDYVEIIKILINAGAEPLIQDGQGLTALDLTENSEIIELLKKNIPSTVIS